MEGFQCIHVNAGVLSSIGALPVRQVLGGEPCSCVRVSSLSAPKRIRLRHELCKALILFVSCFSCFCLNAIAHCDPQFLAIFSQPWEHNYCIKLFYSLYSISIFLLALNKCRSWIFVVVRRLRTNHVVPVLNPELIVAFTNFYHVVSWVIYKIAASSIPCFECRYDIKLII